MPPDANTIALVSVIGATSTAVAVPIINGFFAAQADERRCGNERRQKDLDERRALLDDCAHALTDYVEATRSLTGRFAFSDPRTSEARTFASYEQAIDASILAKQCAYALNRRLVIRLGRDHEVVVAYGAVLRPLDEATADIALRISHREHGRPDGREEIMVRMSADEAVWSGANEQYLDAATGLVGSP